MNEFDEARKWVEANGTWSLQNNHDPRAKYHTAVIVRLKDGRAGVGENIVEAAKEAGWKSNG